MKTDLRQRQVEQEYERIFQATTDGLVINDLDGRVLEVNPAFCRMHGYSYEEMIGLHPSSFVHPDYHAVLAAYLENTRKGESFQTRAIDLRKDGTPIRVEVHGAPFLYKGKPTILGVVRDVTERWEMYRSMEARVEERTRELTALLDLSRNMASTLELQPLLELILGQLASVIADSGASLWTLENDAFVLTAIRAHGPRARNIRPHFAVTEMGLIWEILQRAEPVNIRDVRGDSPEARDFRRMVGGDLDTVYHELNSFLFAPLIARDRVIGILSLVHRLPQHFTERHAELAVAIANQAAIAIENARLYEQARDLAVLEERARLARNLHDSVTQALFSMTMHAQVVQLELERENIPAESALARSVAQLRELTQGALAEMRAVIFELRPGALAEDGLVEAIRKQSAALGTREGLAVEFSGPCERLELLPTEEEHLYRLVLEALHNVVKHAHATRVSIRLEHGKQELMVRVADNGLGFDPSDVPDGPMGLESMAERVKKLGGRLQIEGVIGQGTTVTATIPGEI